jgi:hypothetical protein
VSSRWATRSSWSARVVRREAETSLAYDEPPAAPASFDALADVMAANLDLSGLVP